MQDLRILIVEDEPDNREIVRAVVEDMVGCAAILAGDGLEALERAGEGVPSLVLLDLMLPGLDGYEVARRLRSDPRTRDVPIIAITALARPVDRVRATQAGCDDYVDKPFDLDLLERKIRARLVGNERVKG